VTIRQKLLTTAYWIVPPLFCLAVYWPGLLTWFQMDDFAWLTLPNQVYDWHSLLRVLFQPSYAQGSWRPLSERAFFLAFGAMFGDYALPYRICVFLTQFANLALAASITTRLTGSRAAGFLAAILWTANSKLATVMAWTSAYNQVLCGLFLLLALHLFLRYTETGARRFYVGTWLVFLTGFLAMEVNVVFPLLAGTYALACARKYFRATLPFLAVSAIYAALHLTLAPTHGSTPYTIYIDSAIPATFLTYWRRAFEPTNLHDITGIPAFTSWLEMAAVTVALLAFTIYQARRRQWLALVFLAWFVIMLAPILPLREHIYDYYLTLPAVPLAMLGGYALVSAWRAVTGWKELSAAMAAGVLAAVFLILSLPVAWFAADWYYRRAERARALVWGVERVHELHPGKVILLDGVDDELFWASIRHSPFQYLQIPDVYLAPGSLTSIRDHPDLALLSPYVLPAAVTLHGLDSGDIVIYRVGRGPLREITQRFVVPGNPQGAPLRVDAADPLDADYLGPTWYHGEGQFRWMPRTAGVRISGPLSAAQKLYVTAFCPAAQLTPGPLKMTLTIDGVEQAPVEFTRGDIDSTFVFTPPPASIGKSNMEITVKVNRTTHAGADERALGLAFGVFEIR